MSPGGPGAVAASTILLTVLVGAVLLALVGPPARTTVLRLDVDGRAARTLVLEDDRFELRFEHSVNGFHVREWLQVRDEALVVVDQWVDGDGAGIDEVPGEATWQAAGDGWRHLPGLERQLPSPTVVRIGAIADHRLVVGCSVVPLSTVGDPYEAVRLSVDRSIRFPRLASRLHGTGARAVDTDDCAFTNPTGQGRHDG